MNLAQFRQRGPFEWEMPPHGAMRVPGVIFASRELLEAMDAKVGEQLANVAALPGIVDAAYAMPDAHWGYGFPIGGVAAFDAEEGGVVSAGGVGFDISCGVRSLHTGLKEADIQRVQERLADVLFRRIPAGLGSTGVFHLTGSAMGAMLRGGAKWAVEQGFGSSVDLAYIEEGGCMAGAAPAEVSGEAKHRQRDEMGTLGSVSLIEKKTIKNYQSTHAPSLEDDVDVSEWQLPQYRLTKYTEHDMLLSDEQGETGQHRGIP